MYFTQIYQFLIRKDKKTQKKIKKKKKIIARLEVKPFNAHQLSYIVMYFMVFSLFFYRVNIDFRLERKANGHHANVIGKKVSTVFIFSIMDLW